jgi:glucose dehydrogenase
LAAAAGLHLAVFPSHLEEGTVFGGFFLAVAGVQLAAVAVVGANGGRRALWAVALVNVGVVAVWAVSRTTGLPVGPEPGHVEPVSVLDSLSGAAEVVAIAGALVLARDSLVLPRHRLRAGLAAIAVGVTAFSTAVGLAYADSHPEVHTGHHEVANTQSDHYVSVTSHAAHSSHAP